VGAVFLLGNFCLTRVLPQTGGQDAGKWVFYLEETASTRCHVLAVESEQLREKWLSLLQAAADPAQAHGLRSPKKKSTG